MSDPLDHLAISATELAPFITGAGAVAQAQGLLRQQRGSWDLLRAGYETLQSVRTRTFQFDGFQIKVQFNVGRFASTAAKVDAQSIRERKCFLCVENLPAGQRGIRFDDEFVVLCNPFPIFPEHFTIPSRRHVPQRLETTWPTLLKLGEALGDRYTVFYNGPRCGASAPDHLHFQAGNREFLPVDAEYPSLRAKASQLLATARLRVYAGDDCLRRFFAFESAHAPTLLPALQSLYRVLQSDSSPGEEPMMNVLCFWGPEGWRVLVFPRARHRPSCYFAQGDQQLLISPAAVELGGICTTPRVDDFAKVTREHLVAIYEEIGVSSETFAGVKRRLEEALAGLPGA